MDAAIQQSGAGGVIGGIVVIGVLGLFVVAKVGAFKQTKCMHCGHDNGLTGFQAAICPACGRNKTVFNSRKARKR